MTNEPHPAEGVPEQAALLSFLREADGPVSLKEIAQAFGLRRADHGELRALLKHMVESGILERNASRAYLPGRGLPPVTVVEVVSVDADGELLARPSTWRQGSTPPTVYLASDRRGSPAPAQGDRVLARLTQTEDGSYEAQPIRVLGGAPNS